MIDFSPAQRGGLPPLTGTRWPIRCGHGFSAEELAQLRELNREAQFYWDFVFVENSEGAHNSKLSTACLDRAEELTDQALALISQ